MSCWDEYFQYVGGVALATGAIAAVMAEVGSGVGTPLSVPTAVAAVAAVAGAIALGFKYAECLENEGKATEAQRMRDEMNEMQREIDRMRELVGV